MIAATRWITEKKNVASLERERKRILDRFEIVLIDPLLSDTLSLTDSGLVKPTRTLSLSLSLGVLGCKPL